MPDDESAPKVPETRKMTALPKGARNIKMAIATGLAIAVIAVVLLLLGRGPFFLLILVLILLAQGEFYFATRKAGYDPATALGLTAGGVMLVGAYLKGEAAIPLVIFLALLFSFVWYMGSEARGITVSLGITLLGVAYVPLLGSFVVLMLRMPAGAEGSDGRGIAIVAAGAAALYDVFAYAGGYRWGRRRLSPAISPSKTVEGALIATVGILVAAVLLAPVFGPWSRWQAAVLGLLIAVFAPLGDLFESLIKRDLGIKDMGTIFPGHGGALDRFDAILFAAPAAYLSLRIFGLY